jgi:hypothetical protein
VRRVRLLAPGLLAPGLLGSGLLGSGLLGSGLQRVRDDLEPLLQLAICLIGQTDPYHMGAVTEPRAGCDYRPLLAGNGANRGESGQARADSQHWRAARLASIIRARLASLLIVLGEAGLFMSLWLLAYAGTMAVFFHLFVTGYEERALHRRFGSSYREYQHMVSRWIPHPPRRGLSTVQAG